jgi:hypothetical protein
MSHGLVRAAQTGETVRHEFGRVHSMSGRVAHESFTLHVIGETVGSILVSPYSTSETLQ